LNMNWAQVTNQTLADRQGAPTIIGLHIW
jgi:hypothetical protein